MARGVLEREEKRLAKPFRYVAQADDEGLFSGHGAVFDDSHPTSSWRLPPDWTDTLKSGAFKKTLAEHKKLGTLPAMLLQHSSYDLPVGTWVSAEEDDTGLKLSGKLATKTATGKDVYELLKIGALTGLSIGFTPSKVKLDEKAKVRENPRGRAARGLHRHHSRHPRGAHQRRQGRPPRSPKCRAPAT